MLSVCVFANLSLTHTHTMDKKDNCLQGGCNPLIINRKEGGSEEVVLQKPQKPVMPKKPQPDNSKSVAALRKPMKTVAFARPAVTPFVMSDSWGARDTRVDFLRYFLLLLFWCAIIGGIIIAFSFGLVDMWLRAPKSALIIMVWVSIPAMLVLFFKGVIPYLRSKVRRVHDFGWSGYASVILPLIIVCLLNIALSCCKVVSYTLLKFELLADAADFSLVGGSWFMFVLIVLIEIWLTYGCIVFPYLQDQRVDAEIKVVAKAKEKRRIWFVLLGGALLGVVVCFLPVVLDIIALTISGISLICSLWSILMFLICLFRKGKALAPSIK